MQDTIHVVIVDDFPVMIEGYESSLAKTPHVKIVGTALYGDELMPLLAQHYVDLLLLDINVPISEENRMAIPIFNIIPQVIRTYPHLNVLIETMYADPSLIKAIIEIGVSGYMLKDDLYAEQEFGAIVTSIVKDNGCYWSPEVIKLLEKPKGEKNKEEPHLTPRQIEAISLCAAYPEKSTAQLAEFMNITDSTFRNHLTGAYFKLGAPSRGAAIAKARQLGLIVSDKQPPFDDLRGNDQEGKEKE